MQKLLLLLLQLIAINTATLIRNEVNRYDDDGYMWIDKRENCLEFCNSPDCAFCSVMDDVPGFCCHPSKDTGCSEKMLEAVQFLTPEDAFQCVMPQKFLNRFYMKRRSADLMETTGTSTTDKIFRKS